MRRIVWVTAAAVIVYTSVGCSSGESIPSAATPAFSPAAGTYTAPQMVTLSCATPGATVYYTTDDSSPTTASIVYSTPIAVATTTTIKAIAVATGYTSSVIAIGTYTINLPTQTATPAFSPGPGTYTSQQSVTLSCTTPGATIQYTVDGSSPTASSTVYAGPITVSSTTTLKAIAVASGYSESGIASGVYTITPPGQVATPSFTPAPGTYPSAQAVTLSCTTAGATIYYTLDGSPPTTSSTVYVGPIALPGTAVVKAVAVADGYTPSDTATGVYTINLPNPAPMPTFSPPPGTYGSPQSVTLSCETPGATIFYWIVEDNPQWATMYKGPIDVSRTMTIKAYAISRNSWSDAATGAYVIGGS